MVDHGHGAQLGKTAPNPPCQSAQSDPTPSSLFRQPARAIKPFLSSRRLNFTGLSKFSLCHCEEHRERSEAQSNDADAERSRSKQSPSCLGIASLRYPETCTAQASTGASVKPNLVAFFCKRAISRSRSCLRYASALWASKGLCSRSMRYTARAILCAVATIAFLGPCIARIRRKNALYAVSVRLTAWAANRKACPARLRVLSVRLRKTWPPEISLCGARPRQEQIGLPKVNAGRMGIDNRQLIHRGDGRSGRNWVLAGATQGDTSG